MAVAEGAMALSNIYQEVKNWIAHQEAYEAEYQKPAPLNEAQRMALQILRLPTQPVSPPASIPTKIPTRATPAAATTTTTAFDPTANHVGNLIEFMKKRNPYAKEPHFYEGPLSGASGFSFRVAIAASLTLPSGFVEHVPEHFPAPGYGLGADGSERRFPSKKPAKQFAAKCATDWLAAKGLMPRRRPSPASSAPLPGQSHLAASAGGVTLGNLGTPGPATPSLKRAAVLGSTSTIPPPPPKRQDTSAAPSPTTAADSMYTPAVDGGPPPTELVSRLCPTLGIVPPKYIITLSPRGGDWYDGRVDFDDRSDEELLSVANDSAVAAVLGKQNARQAVAARVLAQLLEIEAARTAQVESATADW